MWKESFVYVVQSSTKQTYRNRVSFTSLNLVSKQTAEVAKTCELSQVEELIQTVKC